MLGMAAILNMPVMKHDDALKACAAAGGKLAEPHDAWELSSLRAALAPDMVAGAWVGLEYAPLRLTHPTERATPTRAREVN